MTLGTNADGWFVVTCNECGQQLDVDTTNLSDAVHMLKRGGWRPVQRVDGWEHYCPSCVRRKDFGAS